MPQAEYRAGQRGKRLHGDLNSAYLSRQLSYDGNGEIPDPFVSSLAEQSNASITLNHE
ncbi:MAG: hypothetical protein OQK61_06705 [Ignavibacteriaceae bacterium]|nr:hypothetical protein [Ignavibacteriaceae bacterium]